MRACRNVRSTAFSFTAEMIEGLGLVLRTHRPRLCRTSMLILFVVIALLCGDVLAQQKPDVSGDYAGILGSLHVKLHIKGSADASLAGTLDSVDQGAMGLPCDDFHLDGTALSFSVPSVHGNWKGTVSSDGASLAGTWSQGTPMPLTFTRDTFVPASKASAIDGIWLGTLKVGSQSLRIQLTVRSDSSGREYCSTDSLDQNAMGLDCANVLLDGNKLSFDVPSVKGRWEGVLLEGSKNLNGTWNQGSPMPLNFERQAVAQTVKPPSFDAAIAPVKPADLEAVLNRDLAEALKSGALAPGTDAGVVVGVVDHGVKRVFAYGTAKTDSIFEIGSITKTFTGLVLAQMVAQGKVTLDEPVRELLPAGTVGKPDGAEITLLDLATQSSGLPRMPDNFNPADPANPYADYHAANLYVFLGKHGVAKPATASFLYSNLGFGLLGQALAVRAGTSYPNLLRNEITAPMAMKDTVVSLSPDQQKRFMTGHDAEHHPAHAWDLDAFAGAGAIRSSASDMLTYLEANLHPDKLRIQSGHNDADGKTLSSAVVQSHELRTDAVPGTRIALAWLCNTATGSYWHNGATGGYSSYAVFNPKNDYAVVVLSNTSIGSTGSFADLLGQHIRQRLEGQPAVSLSELR
jgi:D-alanyl-D-alanine-carboxypeptidase/D-alanyl-D-alanine-endopeptidase